MEQNNLPQKYHVFLGLTPPEGLVAEILRFQKGKYKPPVKWTKPEKFHLTLFFWEALTAEEYEVLYYTISTNLERAGVDYHLASFISGYHFFLRVNVLYLREISADIPGFREALTPHALVPEFPFKDNPDFIPHWTLGRKFHPGLLDKHKEYFFALDKFIFQGFIPEVALFISQDGEYKKKVLHTADNKRQ
jgi:2'-5' RNA ligase